VTSAHNPIDIFPEDIYGPSFPAASSGRPAVDPGSSPDGARGHCLDEPGIVKGQVIGRIQYQQVHRVFREVLPHLPDGLGDFHLRLKPKTADSANLFCPDTHRGNGIASIDHSKQGFAADDMESRSL
jgi:hypothetical protein